MDPKTFSAPKTGYALAGMAAALLYWAGVSGWLSLALFWVGGAALALLLGALAQHRPDRQDDRPPIQDGPAPAPLGKATPSD